MLKGIQLTLMMGKGIAKPVPQSVIDALTGIQITSGKDQSGFQMTFTMGKNSAIFKTLISRGFFEPVLTRVIIVVTFNGTPNVLMDGFITNQEVSLTSQAGASTITITGDDLSVAMDLIQNVIPYPVMNDYLKINTRLATYAFLGIIPVVIPPIMPILKPPTESHDTQKSTDKAFFQQLAKDNGYVFYIQPGPLPGQSIAYFGPEVNLREIQSAVSVNMDLASNTDGLSFSFNGLANSTYVYTILDPITKKIPIPVPVPNINPFRPPFTKSFYQGYKVEFGEDITKDSIAETTKKILARMMNIDNKAISGSGSIDVFRYGKILKSRSVIGVRGAGITYDGLYYVDSVTHDIKPGSYKQNFSLSRNGLTAISSKVKI